MTSMWKSSNPEKRPPKATFVELSVPLAARLAEALGLPGRDRRSVLISFRRSEHTKLHSRFKTTVVQVDVND